MLSGFRTRFFEVSLVWWLRILPDRRLQAHVRPPISSFFFLSCLFCGDLVNAGKGVKCNLACNQNRVVHTWCCKKAGISNHNFSCDKINEHFIPDKLGEKRARFRDPLSNCVDPARFFCLICGDRVAEWEPEFRGKRSFHHSDLVCCKFKTDDRPCGFSAHLECATIHSKFLLGQKDFLLSDFCCDSVTR